MASSEKPELHPLLPDIPGPSQVAAKAYHSRCLAHSLQQDGHRSTSVEKQGRDDMRKHGSKWQRLQSAAFSARMQQGHSVILAPEFASPAMPVGPCPRVQTESLRTHRVPCSGNTWESQDMASMDLRRDVVEEICIVRHPAVSEAIGCHTRTSSFFHAGKKGRGFCSGWMLLPST